MKEKLIDWSKSLYTRFYASRAVARLIVNQFTRLYYQTPEPVRRWQETTWLGVNVLKNPLDLWNYQEIIFEQKPAVVVECGTARGGSAYYYASLFDLLGAGKVVSVDIAENEDRPQHPRVTYMIGSSVEHDTVEAVRKEIKGAGRVMVILDSDHAKEHVLKELGLYSDMVSVGSYLIVEDTLHQRSPRCSPIWAWSVGSRR